MDSLITGSRFVVFLLLIIGTWLLYMYYFRKMMLSYIESTGAKGFDYAFLVVERFLMLISILVVIALFIAYRPFAGGLFAVAFFAVAYSTIRDIFRGIQLIYELKLEEGEQVRINETSGLIHSLGWTGLFVAGKGSISFHTYHLLARQRINIDRAETPAIFTILVTSEDAELSSTRVKQTIKNQLFLFPLLNHDSQPELVESADGILVRCSIKERNHVQSFINQLKSVNLQAQFIEN